jgi:hypothetical protein
MNDEPQQYWFNTLTGEVEVGKQSAAIYRIGPFSTREGAARALQTLAERTKAWQSEEEIED